MVIFPKNQVYVKFCNSLQSILIYLIVVNTKARNRAYTILGVKMIFNILSDWYNLVEAYIWIFL